MKVEVWSDIMCPFCYIGKRNYDDAIQQFANKNEIEIVWKSFQLDPSRSGREDVYEYLAERKGISREQAIMMQAQVTAMANEVGLEYHLDRTIMANTFKAHRLIQFAKEKGQSTIAEEALFSANFTEGQDIDDPIVLKRIAQKIGFSFTDVDEALTNQKYADLVTKDIHEAKQVGVTGVPFFIFNREYVINGARPPEVFLDILEKSFTEWKKDNPKSAFEITTGASCDPDGKCEQN